MHYCDGAHKSDEIETKSKQIFSNADRTNMSTGLFLKKQTQNKMSSLCGPDISVSIKNKKKMGFIDLNNAKKKKYLYYRITYVIVWILCIVEYIVYTLYVYGEHGMIVFFLLLRICLL